MFRRTLMLPVVVGLVLAIVGSASAAIVRVRVEGKSQTIFGATQPRASATTALDALESASIGGEFYYHVQVTGFGPYVDQIGRNAAAGSTAGRSRSTARRRPSAPTRSQLKDGDVVLWYWADVHGGGRPAHACALHGRGAAATASWRRTTPAIAVDVAATSAR